MDTFPEVIRIKVYDIESKIPIEHLALKIRLYAKHKNDYNFILPLSDKDGQIYLTREWLEKKVQKERELFIMDYASDLSDCELKISVKVLDKMGLERAIDAMYLYQDYSELSNEDIEMYKKVTNYLYEPIEKTVHISSPEENISIELRTILK